VRPKTSKQHSAPNLHADFFDISTPQPHAMSWAETRNRSAR
jgi:hypothetical protein